MMKKGRMTAWLAGLLLLAAALPAAGEDAAAFLFRVRTRNLAETSSRLEGILQYQSQDGAMEEHSCVLLVRLGMGGMQARMSVDGKPGVQLAYPARATKAVETESGAILQRCGIRISDLTMSFLQYKLVKELASERVRGIVCRVLELAAPDGKERVHVYLSRDYLVPLKAAFFEGDSQTPARTLEIASFKQQNGIYYAELINFRGPRWRSRVTFNRVQLKKAAPGETLPPEKLPDTTGSAVKEK